MESWDTLNSKETSQGHAIGARLRHSSGWHWVPLPRVARTSLEWYHHFRWCPKVYIFLTLLSHLFPSRTSRWLFSTLHSVLTIALWGTLTSTTQLAQAIQWALQPSENFNPWFFSLNLTLLEPQSSKQRLADPGRHSKGSYHTVTPPHPQLLKRVRCAAYMSTHTYCGRPES